MILSPTKLRQRLTGHLLWQNPALGSIVLAVFVVFLGIGTILPVLTLYAEKRGITVAEIGFATAAYMLANFLFQVPMGWLSDRVGRKPLMLFGLAIHILISLLYLGLTDAPMLLMLRFLDGLGGAAVWPAAKAYVMDTVPAEGRGQALGLVGAGINGGIMIGPAIGGLMGGLAGFSGPLYFGAITGAVSLVFLFFAVKERHGVAVKDETATVSLTGDLTTGRVNWVAIAPVALLSAAGGVGNGVFSVLWNVWLNDLHASAEVIGLSYTVFALPLLVVGPIAGRLADRHNRVLFIVLPGLVSAGVYFSYAFLTDIPTIIALGLLEGAALACMWPAIDSYFADVTPERLRGRVQGANGAVNTAVGFIVSASVGVVYQSGGAFWTFIALTVAMVLPLLPAALLMAPFEARLRPRRPTESAAPEGELKARVA